MKENSLLLSLDERLNAFFKYKKYGSSLKTELKAGFAIFVSMAYVVFLIPSLLAHGGLIFASALSSTICLIIFCTSMMAFYTNRPFVLAPSLGSTAIFSYTLMGTNIPQSVASGIIVVSGILFIIISFLGGRDFINRLIPDGIKISIGAGVGLFIALIGLKQVGIIVVNVRESALVFGDIVAPHAMLAILGFFVILALVTRRTFAAVMIAVIAITLLGIPMGITKLPQSFFALPAGIGPMFGKVDILAALNIIYLPFYLTFFMSDFFGSQSTMKSVGKEANLLDKNGHLKNINRNFQIDSLSTTIGGFFSSPIVTIYGESFIGARFGGRTGLCALVAAFLFIPLLFMAPIARMIPQEASAPLLIILGIYTLKSLQGLNYAESTNYLPAFICIAISIFSFNGGNVGNGIAAALLIYAFIKIVNGRIKEDHFALYLLIPVIIYYFYAEAFLY